MPSVPRTYDEAVSRPTENGAEKISPKARPSRVANLKSAAFQNFKRG